MKFQEKILFLVVIIGVIGNAMGQSTGIRMTSSTAGGQTSGQGSTTSGQGSTGVAGPTGTVTVTGTGTSGSGSGSGALPQSPCDRLVVANGGSFTVSSSAQSVMGTFVNGVAGGVNGNPGLFDNSATKGFFDGSINYRANGPVLGPFTGNHSLGGLVSPNAPAYSATNSPYLPFHAEHLIAFFGNAFGCSATNFPVYSNLSPVPGYGTFNQYQVHANMNLTQTQFSAFTSIFISSLTSMSMNSTDLNFVSSFLSGFERNTLSITNSICTDVSCVCANGITGTNCGTMISSSSSGGIPAPPTSDAGGQIRSHQLLLLLAITSIFLITKRF